MLEMTRRPPAESMRTPTIRQREVGSRASRSKNVVDEARRWRVERLTRRCVTSQTGEGPTGATRWPPRRPPPPEGHGPSRSRLGVDRPSVLDQRQSVELGDYRRDLSGHRLGVQLVLLGDVVRQLPDGGLAVA